MASKTTLTAANLTALGAERLADLLIELSLGDAAAKRRLRLALAGTAGPDKVAREIRKRLTTIGRARSFVDWDKVKVLVVDLEGQRRAIVDQVAPGDAQAALDLMWSLLGLASSVFDRCDDSNGRISPVFRLACKDLRALASAASPPLDTLVDQTFSALSNNDYGQYDTLVETLTPVLGVEGLTLLRQKVTDLANDPETETAKEEKTVIGWGLNGPVYASQLRASAQANMVRQTLIDIADALGDVDAFISQLDAQTLSSPYVATNVAGRLLAAGRAEEALAAAERARPHEPEAGSTPGGWVMRPDWELESLRLQALDALGRTDEAQAARWDWFGRYLTAEPLRDHLKRLADFDDVEAEDRAMLIAVAYPELDPALEFLVSWPALSRAADLIIARVTELDGNRYELLSPSAGALAAKHPLAATLLLRAMIDYTLDYGLSARYRHAARHLLECESLSGSITDYGTFADHEGYVAGLRTSHGRKVGFWGLLPDTCT